MPDQLRTKYSIELNAVQNYGYLRLRADLPRSPVKYIAKYNFFLGGPNEKNTCIFKKISLYGDLFYLKKGITR